MNKDLSIYNLSKEIEELQEENKRYEQALEEIWHILNVTPYREYTTNKIRGRLFHAATYGLKGVS